MVDANKLMVKHTKLLQETSQFLEQLSAILNTSVQVMENENYDDVFFINTMKGDVTKFQRRINLSLKKWSENSEDVGD